MNLLKDKYIRVTRVIYDKIFEYIILLNIYYAIKVSYFPYIVFVIC